MYDLNKGTTVTDKFLNRKRTFKISKHSASAKCSHADKVHYETYLKTSAFSSKIFLKSIEIGPVTENVFNSFCPH